MSKFKKMLSWVLVVALTAGISIAGTMAYFTDEDSAVNVMAVGNVQITQNEQERIDHTNVEVGLQDFTQGQSIVPAADVTGAKDAITVNGYHLNIRTGETYVDKIVSVTNDGVNDAYIRTIFAFPEAGDFDTTTDASDQWFHWNGVSDTDTDPNNGWMWGADKTTEWPGNAGGWDVVENVEINGKKYDIYVATNKNVIKSGESTSPSLMGFYLDTRVDFDGTNYTFTDKNGKEWNLGDISNLDILVLSQAVQKDGFADAWTALDEAFGDVTAENAADWFSNMDRSIEVSTYEELVAAVQKGGDIKVVKDITLTGSVIIPAGNSVTINLNGKTLTNAVTGEGEGEDPAAILVSEGASAEISNGSVLNTINAKVNGIRSLGNLVLNNVTATSVRHVVRIEAGTAVINGGNYYPTYLEGTEMTTFTLYVKGGSVTVNGGTFSGPKGTSIDSGSALKVQENGSVTINDGKFIKGKNSTVVVEGTLSIKGGTYDQDPSSYVDAGYSAKEADGVWTVSVK